MLHLLTLRKVSLLLVQLSSYFPVLTETVLDAREPLQVAVDLRSLIPNNMFFREIVILSSQFDSFALKTT